MAGTARLPLLVYLVLISTGIACVWGGVNILGFRLTGWGWVIPLAASLVLLALNLARVTFPFPLWLPWLAVILLYMTVSDWKLALQRSIMLFTPLIVGMAVSCFTVTEAALERFVSLCRMLVIGIGGMVLFQTGLIFTGILPSTTGYAPQMITVILLGTLFAVQFNFGQKRGLLWWGAALALIFITNTRGPLAVAIVSLPLTLGPLNWRMRVGLLVGILLVGIALFYTPHVQRKMFLSGKGELTDLRWDNPDLETSGRAFMWARLMEEIRKKPWLGHGANVSEAFTVRLMGGLTHPHNDWLRLLYDYGVLGTAVFATCLVMQMLHTLRLARQTEHNTRLLLYAGASSFIPFALIMLTDNVILYAAFFGNLQFTMLGLGYASAATSQRTIVP